LLVAQLVALWDDNYRVYGARKLWKAARRAAWTSAATRPPG
jgi:putative transposase